MTLGATPFQPRRRPTAPIGLYDPAFEHDSCGVAFVARLNGEPSHEAIDAGAHRAREPRAPRRDRRRPADGRRRRAPDPAARRALPRRDLRGAAARGRLRRLRLLPAARRRRAPRRARADPRRHRRGRGPARDRLARRPDGARPRRHHRARGRSDRPPADRRRVDRARRRPRRLRAEAVRDPAHRGDRRRARARDPELLGAHDRLQGDADGAAAPRLLPRPVRRADEERARPDPLALLNEHLPELGARPPVPLHRAQRRDQRAARQRQLDARARVAARVRALRRRPEEDPADRPARRLGHGDLRQRARAARARRPLGTARDDDDDPRGLRRPRGPERRAAGLLCLPRLPDRTVGWPRLDLVHRRHRDRRDARSERLAPRPLDGDEGRLGRARLRDRRAR